MWPWSAKQHADPAPVHDDILGELSYGDGDWNGAARRSGNDLELSIAGDKAGPDALGRELLVAALNRLEELVAEAKAFLLKDLTPADVAKGQYNFRPTGIWSGAAWQLKQRSITLALELDGDEFALWRVEIGPSGPIDSGRDS